MRDLLSHFSRWFERDDPLLSAQSLHSLYSASLKDSAANQFALQWANRYREANDDERYVLLEALTSAQELGEINERDAVHLFRRFYAQSNCLTLMLMLRADMLRWGAKIADLPQLEQALAALLLNWFEVGMLELRPITWDSPASLLEKLIEYEAVHEIQSWADMKRRVATDRRCYAFFHPRLPDVPLVFVEVALADHMATHVHELLDPTHPVVSTEEKAHWAIFYSISNTQRGLRGISFGGFLLKRVMDALTKELPTIKSFATLSPIPGFSKWLAQQSSADIQAYLLPKNKQTKTKESIPTGQQLMQYLRDATQEEENEELKQHGVRLVAHYLNSLNNGIPVDAVARFHLGNGASLERINWAADKSAKGLDQSCGFMVNYLYEPDKLDANRLRLEAGNPPLSRKVQRLLH